MKHLNLTILGLFLSCASFALTPITGPSTVCVGAAVAETDATAGGTWTCASPILGIDIATGIVTGISAGSTTITYTVGASSVTYAMTVAALPGPIVGPSVVCVGLLDSLSDTTTGGTWSSSTPSIATVGPYGVTGISAGIALITYASPSGCIATMTLTVIAVPAPITGMPSICAGGSSTLSDGTGGGVWSSSSPAVASVSSGSGVVTGLIIGTAAITYSIGTGCSVSTMVTVTAASAYFSVTGGGSFCSGGSGVVVGLGGSTSGALYQLYNGTTPVGSPVTGTGAAISFGLQTATGIDSVKANPGTTCASTMTGSASITVNPLPIAYTITGGGSYCSGGSGADIGIAGSQAGVTYQLYLGGTVVATIVGTGTALDFGMETAAGVYTVVAIDPTTGCVNTMTGSVTVTVSPLPAIHTATGGGSYCAGGAGVDVGLDGSDIGTNYQLYNGASPVGLPMAGTGSSLDFGFQTATGTYTVAASDGTTACSDNMAGSATVTINPLPTVTASATPASCGGVVTLTAGGATSYSWSPTTGLSCTGCASPALLPTATTLYTVIGTDGSGCTNTATVSVDGNRISGYISYSGTPSASDFKIWLVQFNPADSSITATDSVANCVDGGTAYYEFMDKPAGSYMVKARLNSSVPGTSGYIPTYSLSTPHWDSAATISHTSDADSLHINMVYGTVPSGPGFISGYVVSGAGRNTSGDIPAVGMLIYLKDASGNVITYNYTAADGSYSFGSLANGTYIIYPEAYKYYTTPSTAITLSTTMETASGVNFKQHTSYGTITPNITTNIIAASPASGVSIYPNPTTGNLNIQWGSQASGIANIVITDVVGREMYNSTVTITASGNTVNISGVNDGIYLITIKSDKIYYCGKVIKGQQ